jgi:hypothetical protein
MFNIELGEWTVINFTTTIKYKIKNGRKDILKASNLVFGLMEC